MIAISREHSTTGDFWKMQAVIRSVSHLQSSIDQGWQRKGILPGKKSKIAKKIVENVILVKLSDKGQHVEKKIQYSPKPFKNLINKFKKKYTEWSWLWNST